MVPRSEGRHLRVLPPRPRSTLPLHDPAGFPSRLTMPIRPSEKKRYPKDWKQIAARIRARAGDRCECLGECGILHQCRPPETRCRLCDGPRCSERNRESALYFKGKVILTVAHLDHTPENCADENLRAFCQRCHLRYDGPHHAETARRTREAKDPQLKLFPPKA